MSAPLRIRCYGREGECRKISTANASRLHPSVRPDAFGMAGANRPSNPTRTEHPAGTSPRRKRPFGLPSHAACLAWAARLWHIENAEIGAHGKGDRHGRGACRLADSVRASRSSRSPRARFGPASSATASPATATTSASAASSRSSPTSTAPSSIRRISTRASFVDIEGDFCLIPPNSFALAETVEYFEIPRDVLTICVGKSTYARCGIIINVTPLEPEWRGTRHPRDQQHHAAARQDLRQRRHRPDPVPPRRRRLPDQLRRQERQVPGPERASRCRSSSAGNRRREADLSPTPVDNCRPFGYIRLLNRVSCSPAPSRIGLPAGRRAWV